MEENNEVVEVTQEAPKKATKKSNKKTQTEPKVNNNIVFKHYAYSYFIDNDDIHHAIRVGFDPKSGTTGNVEIIESNEDYFIIKDKLENSIFQMDIENEE